MKEKKDHLLEPEYMHRDYGNSEIEITGYLLLVFSHSVVHNKEIKSLEYNLYPSLRKYFLRSFHCKTTCVASKRIVISVTWNADFTLLLSEWVSEWERENVREIQTYTCHVRRMFCQITHVFWEWCSCNSFWQDMGWQDDVANKLSVSNTW